MKRLITLAFLSIVSLAACGGGGGGGTITPSTPTPSPSSNVQYVSKLVFTGALAGRQMQSELRRPMDGTATPSPILVVSPIKDGCLGFDCVATGNGTVQAVVSPQPSSMPVTTFSNTAPHVIVAPTPVSSAAPGVIAEATVANDGTTNVQTSGTASAAIGSPVNQQPTTQVYQYLALAVECVPGDATYSPGYAWNGTAWTSTSDPSQADIYITGAGCAGAYSVTGDTGTLHFPGGGALLSTDESFASVTVSQWTNAETSIAGTTLSISNGDGSTNSMLVAKTRSGVVFKMFPNMKGDNNGGFNYIGAVEVSGTGVDGF